MKEKKGIAAYVAMHDDNLDMKTELEEWEKG